jgi:hypothetical protein
MSDVLEVKRLPQDKPQLFSTLVTIVRENVGGSWDLLFTPLSAR